MHDKKVLTVRFFTVHKHFNGYYGYSYFVAVQRRKESAMAIKNRGFASMTAERRKEIARMGGKASGKRSKKT